MTAPRSTLFLGCASTLIGIATLTLMPGAAAQIIPDDSLGAENSTVGVGAIDGLPTTLIDGGATRESNLFHSFLEFNVGEGQRVYFANPLGIESILSRVTGGNPSNIFGRLGVAGTADLFLVNPNGIVFGENATLDIAGSFYGTTADAISLGDKGLFSATNPEQSTLLTIDPSIVFTNYLTAESGNIQSRGQLAAGENLTLAGNRLDLQGQVAAGADLTLLGREAVQIRDAVDVPFIGFAGSELLVQGNEQVDIVALSHLDSGLYSYGDMVLRSANPVGGDAHYWSAGNFRVETLDGETGNLFSPVDPVIRTFGDVAIGTYIGTSLHILAGGSVQIGLANITGPAVGAPNIDFLQETVELSDGTIIAIDGAAQPTVDVRAGVLPDAIGIPDFNFLPGLVLNPVFTAAPSNADIAIGDVAINAPGALVLLTNQYQPNLVLPGGNIQIESQIAPFAGVGGIIVGNFIFNIPGGGEVFVDARNDITVTNSVISTTAPGDSGGDVALLAAGDIRFDNPANLPSGVITGTLATSTQRGGDIKITSANLFMSGGAVLTAGTLGEGDAGDVVINATDQIIFDGTSADGQFRSGAASEVGAGATGDGGSVEISTNSLEVTNGAGVSASTFGAGDAGEVVITAEGQVLFDGTSADGQFRSGAASEVGAGATGDGGSVEISTNFLEITNGAGAIASTFGEGDAGDVIIDAAAQVVFDGTSADGQLRSAAGSEVGAGAIGDGGSVEISTNSLEVTNGAGISATTFGEGDAGDVIIDAAARVVFDGTSADGQLRSAAGSEVGAGAIGDGGSVEISTNSLEVRNGAALGASTFGEGDAGDVVIDAAAQVTFDGASANGELRSFAVSQVGTSAIGDGGSVEISTNSLEVRNGAALSASTLGEGDAGDIVIDATAQAIFDGTSPNGQFSSAAGSEVGTGAIGDGGSVEISTNSLEVTNGAGLSTSTFGEGDAGDVVIDAAAQVIFDGTSPDEQFRSGTGSEVGTGAIGEGGSIEISTNSLEVTNGAVLSVSTFGEGDAGDVLVRASGDVFIDGVSRAGQFISAVSSEVDIGATGNSGSVDIRASNITLDNGGRIQTSTSGAGNAGNVFLEAVNDININGAIARGRLAGTPSFILSANGRGSGEIGSGVGGRIDLKASSITLSDGAVIDARTFNDQPGGDITINTSFLDLLDGGQIVSISDGNGSAGTIAISATDTIRIIGSDSDFFERVTSTPEIGRLIQDNSNISVRSRGNGSAGNIVLNSGELILSDRGQIIAESAAVDGGNITLNLTDLLLLRNNSLISASAGTEQAGGNGGNISISVPFIIAIPEENSDIAADAFEGTGGNVTINARGVFGIEPRAQRTPLSDITASSELGITGTVSFNVLDTGFIENNLSDFDENIVDTTALTAGSCIARDADATGSFVVTGGEGLPQRPGGENIAVYPTGTVQTVFDAATTNTLQEPESVYRLADGRLVLSHECETPQSGAAF